MVLWKDVPGYAGLYEISNTGVVRGKNGIRKPQLSWDGYLYVKLCNNGHEQKHKIHRLVAMAFIPNPQGLPEINHKDENKQNNHVDNLEWCTRIYNNRYGMRGKKAGIGIRKAFQKRVYRFDRNGNYIDSFESVKLAGIQMNINPSAISDVARGKRKTAGGYKWSYDGKGSAGNHIV